MQERAKRFKNKKIIIVVLKCAENANEIIRTPKVLVKEEEKLTIET